MQFKKLFSADSAKKEVYFLIEVGSRGIAFFEYIYGYVFF